jgi:hypothetical protein
MPERTPCRIANRMLDRVLDKMLDRMPGGMLDRSELECLIEAR